MDIDPLKLRAALGRERFGPPREFGEDGAGWMLDEIECHQDLRGRRIPVGSVIVTSSDLPDDDTVWIHASIARSDPKEMPPYSDLVLLHQAVWGDGWAYQAFAPPTSHINIHPSALHLWGRADGKPVLPDFGSYFRSI